MGTDWIESQEDLSLVKSTVLEIVKKSGTSVLNADDSVTMSVLDRARGNIEIVSEPGKAVDFFFQRQKQEIYWSFIPMNSNRS